MVLPLLAGSVDVRVASSLELEEAPTVSRPVSKVITLLKDMTKQLQEEASADQEVYDKIACWCTTNEEQKTKAIADGKAKIQQLTEAIEAGAALSKQLNAESIDTQKKLKASQDALDKATAIREKEAAAFQGEEKDLLESVAALKAAIEVLSKHQGKGNFGGPEALVELSAKKTA